MKKNRMICVFLILALVLAIAGCGSAQTVETPKTNTQSEASGTPAASQPVSTGAEKKTVNVTVLMPNAGDTYFQNKSYGYTLGEQSANSEFPELNVVVKMYDAGGYEYAEKQISQMEDAITQGVDIIVLTPCDSEALVPYVEKARAAGIIVINDDIAVNCECDSALYENSVRAGKLLGYRMAESMNYSGNVCLLKGPSSGSLFVNRGRGVVEGLSPFVNIKVLDEQFQTDDVMAGMSQVEDWISRFGDELDGIYIHGATQAIVAADSLRAAGYKAGDVKIFTFDVSTESLQYLAEGWITGIVPAQPIKVAQMAVIYGVRAYMGVDIPEKVYTNDDYPILSDEADFFDTGFCMAPDGWAPALN